MKALFALSLLFLTACSHSISLRATHFAAPVVAESQWGGHAAVVAASQTRVTVIDDIATNPPTRTKVRINDDADVGDMFGANNIGFDASLSVYKGIEIYMDNFLWGARYQFLNHGSQTGVWVGAIQGAFGTKSESTDEFSINHSTSQADAKSSITTSQAGISLGYKLQHVVPYFSYIYEAHKIETDVKNTHGTFGPYTNEGVHGYYSLGLSTYQRGFRIAAEYSYIDIKWKDSEQTGQGAFGIKAGFAW